MSGAPKPWLLYGPLIVGGLIFGAYGVLWNMGAGEMRRSIEAWAEDQRADGVDVSFDEITTEGFPFFLRGAVSDVSIGDEGVWAWRAPELHIDAIPLALDRLIFSARQAHQIEIDGIGAWRIEAPDGKASIANDNARAWIVDVESGKADLARIASGERISLEKFLLTVAPAEYDRETIEASLAVAGVTANREGASINVPRFEAMAALRSAPFLEEGAAVWRAAGGALELRHFLVEADGGRIALSGELTIDPQGFPTGLLNAELVNPAALALVLAEAGVISEEDAARTGAALTLAAIASGGKITAPLILENAEATIAGVKIAKLSRVLEPAQP